MRHGLLVGERPTRVDFACRSCRIVTLQLAEKTAGQISSAFRRSGSLHLHRQDQMRRGPPRTSIEAAYRPSCACRIAYTRRGESSFRKGVLDVMSVPRAPLGLAR